MSPPHVLLIPIKAAECGAEKHYLPLSPSQYSIVWIRVSHQSNRNISGILIQRYAAQGKHAVIGGVGE